MIIVNREKLIRILALYKLHKEIIEIHEGIRFVTSNKTELSKEVAKLLNDLTK